MDVHFTVGIEDFVCQAMQACSQCSTQNAQFSVSFGVHGNFLSAAQNDTLDATVDYDALCQELATELRPLPCGDASAIANLAKATISRFSARITGGYVAIRILCHEPFIVEQALL